MNARKLLLKHTLALKLFTSSVIALLSFGCSPAPQPQSTLKLNDLEYFETRGLNVLVFSNWYNENFDDYKISGVEIIHHETRRRSGASRKA